MPRESLQKEEETLRRLEGAPVLATVYLIGAYWSWWATLAAAAFVLWRWAGQAIAGWAALGLAILAAAGWAAKRAIERG